MLEIPSTYLQKYVDAVRVARPSEKAENINNRHSEYEEINKKLKRGNKKRLTEADKNFRLAWIRLIEENSSFTTEISEYEKGGYTFPLSVEGIEPTLVMVSVSSLDPLTCSSLVFIRTQGSTSSYVLLNCCSSVSPSPTTHGPRSVCEWRTSRTHYSIRGSRYFVVLI